MYRLVVADLDSPSYFVATAAVELGFFREEGIDAEVERAYGALNGPERLRNGEFHFLGGPAYMATRAFPGWNGAKLLCALAQYSYGFWRCAPTSISSAATSMRLRACVFRRPRLSPKSGCVTCSSNQASIWNGIRFRSCRCRAPRTSTSSIASASMRSPRTLRMRTGAMGCGSRSGKNSASPRCISICAAATARRTRVSITSWP